MVINNIESNIHSDPDFSPSQLERIAVLSRRTGISVDELKGRIYDRLKVLRFSYRGSRKANMPYALTDDALEGLEKTYLRK